MHQAAVNERRLATRFGRQERAAILFVLPVVLLFVFIRIIPALVAVYLSFTDYTVLTPPKWAGLKNYVNLFRDKLFLQALWHTLLYTLGTVIPGIILSLGAALLLNRKIKGRAVFRVAFYTPVVASFVSVSMIWSYIYNPNFGVLNYVLSLLGFSRLSWLEHSSTALMSIIIVGIWKNIGYNAIIFLAGLQGIPASLLEAGKMDGLNAVKRFRFITWPMLKPTTLFICLINTIFGLQVFDPIFVLTNGGPSDSTNVVVFEVYRNAFLYSKMGYASAEAVLLFIVIVVFVYLILKASRYKL